MFRRISGAIAITLGIFIIQVVEIHTAQCPQPNGKFPVEEQCDAYIECIDGVAEEKLCPDGLVFNDEFTPDGDCVIKPLVKCGNRLRLQPANSTENCPRQFGFYKFGDAMHCAGYMNCAHGVGTLTYCPFGLAFNSETYQCDWPDEVQDCDPEQYLGFKCPPEEERPVDEEGHETTPEKLKYYRNEKSCKHYFVCVNDKPRLYTCAQFLVFNEKKKACDFRSKVPECAQEQSETINLKDVTKLKVIEDGLKGFFKSDNEKLEESQA
ncbi:protein obstructor-E isoform X1 [Condylostylus longicornis]|uniref:protein obstructor-E isoform X1 n=1 Tax=Condylostylus longicornis TaxID=2530218 RepID=UPI00244DD7BC|nr:protein obstructor-E isoform X1 [Condylostylus longicornis]